MAIVRPADPFGRRLASPPSPAHPEPPRASSSPLIGGADGRSQAEGPGGVLAFVSGRTVKQEVGYKEAACYFLKAQQDIYSIVLDLLISWLRTSEDSSRLPVSE
ncbi:hypothetical protein SKAU_G00403180 [Synaphobranchus kaupii]|uniref:Uncharacterized protein n=1 Tax=Synaphobranchus kaupii TaxID=118154 RepID=A0A9Q1ICJ1_SYNKA|nr:hypothetical protein SKAU_G00403180 [Synaphobranchus kaupii]